VRLGIKGHSLCPRQSLYTIDDRVFVRAFLSDHCDGSFTVRVKDQARLGVECGSVHVIPDGERGDHLSRVGIHDGHYLASATDEQPPVGPVYSHARG